MANPAMTQWDAQGTPIPARAAPSGQTTQWDASGRPLPAPAMPAPPRPAQEAIASSLTTPADPTASEGTYNMHDASGLVTPVRYSRVHQALDHGLLFADKPTLQQYARDHAADPLDEDRTDQWIAKHPWVEGPVDAGKGLGIGLSKTLTAFDKTPATLPETRMQMLAATPAKGPIQQTGEAGENVAEFFTGEELLGMLGRAGKVMSLAEKMKAVTGLAQMVEKYPMIAKLLKIGSSAAKQGTVAGAQTLVKTGGDVGAAAGSGIATGLTAGVLEGAGAGIRSAIAKHATSVEDVGGVATPVPGETRNIKPTPQQAAGQDALRRSAQNAAASHLEEVNESRRVPESAPALPARTGPFEFKLRGLNAAEGTAGNIAHDAAKFDPTAAHVVPGTEPGPQNAAQLGSTAKTIPDRMQQRTQAYTTSTTGDTVPATERVSEAGGGELTTQDPNIAKAHMAQVNAAVESPSFAQMPAAQQTQLLEAQADMRSQLTRYHEEVLQTLPGYGKPNFPEIDIPKAVEKIGSWSDAAAAVKQTAVKGYQSIMDALSFTGESPQHLTMIRNAYQAAEQKFMAAETPAALGAAESEVESTHEQLRQLLGRVPNTASLKEFSGMNDAYRQALGLQKIGNVIDRSFSAPISSAQRSFEYSGFNGAKLSSGMQGLLRTMGRARLERLMGRENLDTVLQVGQLNSTLAGRARMGAAVKTVADNLAPLLQRMHVGPIGVGGYLGHVTGAGWELGAGAGLAASVAGKRVMNAVLTNPKVAKNLIFAIESGAKPENYGPFLATMIQKTITDASNEQQQQENAQQRATTGNEVQR